MTVGIKHRRLIQYALIACTLLIQIVILIFFYNENINENKLTAIKNQIAETRKLKLLTNESKVELLNAQNYLYEYLNSPRKELLENYFGALLKVTNKIDSTRFFEEKIPSIHQIINSEERQAELDYLERLIDSISRNSPKLEIKAAPVEIKEFNIEKTTPKIEVEQVYVQDSTPKKKFFPRLKDAITGETNVKTDTVIITTTYNNSIDTGKIKSDFDSTVGVINEHYLKEIKNYQKYLQSVQAGTHNVYDVYNNLISLSNNLIDVYDLTSNDLTESLEKQYNERFSKNSQIRRYAVFGLMLLLFFVLIIMAYYTKLSFLYEKKLKEANDRINSNLTFKNRILGMLSHEIRSPLKIMNIFLDRIYKNTDDERIIDSLKSIRFTNNSLLLQANQILEYTKNQDKKIELHPVKFNLRNETNAIFEVFRPYIESVNNTLKVENQIPGELNVFADKSKIHQVFINLLGNANKFTENGEISVQLQVETIHDKMVKLLASFADTGIGISKNDIQRIFEPYYKGVVGESVENLGAGLGLNLCQEIIRLFQGNISIESELGKGTVIHFEININLADA